MVAQMSEAASRQRVPHPRPVLFHVHGIGSHDFSSMTPDALHEIHQIANNRGVDVIPTIFLRPDYLPELTRVLKAWVEARERGDLASILGFGIEGPLLGTSGGVPPAGCWLPDAATWRALAALGDIGLRYIVIAPDALELDEVLDGDLTFGTLIELFYHHGVRLALGHFRHTNPSVSARRTEAVIDAVEQLTHGQPDVLVTDHLFNDMPRAFTHAWRTEEERAHRDEELGAFLTRPWEPDSLADVLGPVPASIVAAARAGRILPMLNFDGDHVDLEICRRTVEYVGADRLIAITDHIEVDAMAGEDLALAASSSLMLRSDGRVAAGTTDLTKQAEHMRGIGLDEAQINELVSQVPRRALAPFTRPLLRHQAASGTREASR